MRVNSYCDALYYQTVHVCFSNIQCCGPDLRSNGISNKFNIFLTDYLIYISIYLYLICIGIYASRWRQMTVLITESICSKKLYIQEQNVELCI